MSRIDYELLAALAAVAREGSFDAAARSLGVTQSAVSQRVKQLEDRVGEALVVRGRPCVATPTGLRLIEHLEQVIILQRELNDDLGRLVGSGPRLVPTIRVSVNNDSLATWFPHVIKRVKDELNLRLDIIPDDQAFTEERLRAGEASAIVTSMDRPIPGFRRSHLGIMTYRAVAAPQIYERHFANGVSAETIRGTPCLVWDRKDTIQDQWMALALGEVVAVTTHSVPSYVGYVECCLNGTAWGIVPTQAAAPYLKSGALVALSPGTDLQLSLFWHASKRPSATLSKLEKILIDVAGDHLSPI
ncbi:MAG: ArgP/LysG family DNA-binding transcriptional regulator [Pseudomonadota bacterium]